MLGEGVGACENRGSGPRWEKGAGVALVGSGRGMCGTGEKDGETQN